MTTQKAKIEMNIPRKRKGVSRRNKAMDKFFDACLS
eukprot:CAMPEP_0201284060 /NCGR_PEP_ID=MMETSP1317-20130820/59773_1 /ASSEMBLY_ACC=CAM_ASM_000770 /TAXON_ID=187299 /ORGANISM="Undescribed Undescribed, Strain Undescribed" /LENGTH=35 /DNA_ID= /DNA_START= /DNA_END= /DNA_ORIENTATION=